MPLVGKTILHLNPSLHAGGAEVSILDAAAAIVAAGGKSIVACGPGRLVSQLESSGATWIPFPADTKNPITITRNVTRLVHLVRDNKVDLIHAHSRAPGWSAYWANQQLKLPFVTSYHGIYGSKGPWKRWYNSVMARGDVVIANSQYTLAHIVTQYPESRDRIKIVYPGTDIEQFNLARVSKARISAVAQTMNIDSTARIVLLPGRITGIKGQRLLIEAAAIVKSRSEANIQFVMMGEAGEKKKHLASLNQLIADLDLEKSCFFVPHNQDMPAALALADLVVMPTLRPEAFGRTVAEASAMERMVVGTDFGAPRETILAPPELDDSKLTGWRFPRGDARALADIISHALTLDVAECKKIGKRGRRHIKDNFSLSNSNVAMIALYNQLLNVDS